MNPYDIQGLLRRTSDDRLGQLIRRLYPHEAIAAFAWPMLLQAGGLAQLTGAVAQALTAACARRRDPARSPGAGGRGAP